MSLESGIREKLNSLRRTITTIYSSNGEVHQETVDEAGNANIIKLQSSAAGYVIDEEPDLAVAKILPWLCLGSQDVTYEYDLLKAHNITHILSIGIPGPPYSDITATFVEALDLNEFGISNLFDQCIKTIEMVRREEGIVFVHCNAGVSRSPTIAAAYLIQLNRISADEAIEMIKRVRPKIKPNDGFMQQLRDFERKIHDRS